MSLGRKRWPGAYALAQDMYGMHPLGNDINGGGDAGDDDKLPAAVESLNLEDSDNDEQDVCYLCLDAHHESREPLRRDCSCRGVSGWVHLSCLVGYAENVTIQSRNRALRSTEEQLFFLRRKFEKPWRDCPNW